MFQKFSNGPNTNTPNAESIAETPPTSTKLTPEAVLEQLRTMQSQIDGLSALTTAQRKASRDRAARQPVPIIAASLDVISSSETVAQAVGQPVDDVLQLQQDEARWNLVAGELRKFLKGVEGGNLLRREQLALIASQAYSVGTQLVRNPANQDLVPHVEEVKRLKSVKGRKKSNQTPQPQAPTTTTTPATAPSQVTTPKPQA